MVRKCASCEGRVEDGLQRVERAVAGHLFRADVPGGKCDGCGEGYFEGFVLGAFERAIAIELARGSALGGEAVRFIRKKTGFAAKDLAVLLDVRPETVSRWENGSRPIDRASFACVVGLLYDSHIERPSTREVLEWLSGERRLPATVTLTLDWKAERRKHPAASSDGAVVSAAQAQRAGVAYPGRRR